MRVVTDERDGVLFLTLTETVMHDDVDALREHLDLISRDRTAPRLVVDMRDLQYLCSSGIGVLIDRVAAYRKKGGDIHLLHVAPRFRRLLKSMEIDRYLHCFDGVDEAVKAFDEQLERSTTIPTTDDTLQSYHGSISELNFPTLSLDKTPTERLNRDKINEDDDAKPNA